MAYSSSSSSSSSSFSNAAASSFSSSLNFVFFFPLLSWLSFLAFFLSVFLSLALCTEGQNETVEIAQVRKEEGNKS